MLSIAQDMLYQKLLSTEIFQVKNGPIHMVQQTFAKEDSENFLGVQSLQQSQEIVDLPSGEPQSYISLQNDIVNLKPCMYASRNAIFVLDDVATSSTVQTVISSDGDQQVVNSVAGQNQVQFNFCEENLKDQNKPAACSSQAGAYAYVWNLFDQSTCTPVLENAEKNPNIQAKDIMEGNTEQVNGLRLVYDSAATSCPSDPTQKLILNVDLLCSDSEQLEQDASEINGCDITLKYKSKMGCPRFQYGILAKFISDYSFLFGAVMIVFGILLAFFGNKFLTIVIGIITGLATIFFGVYLTARFVDGVFNKEDIKDYAVWIILAIWVIVGIVAGIFIAKKRKWGISVVAAFGGVMLGLLLATIFGPAMSNVYIYYALIIGCGILAFVVTFFVEKFVLIIVTSFLGSYAIVRGISMYAGGFPNETELHTMAQDGLIDWTTFPKTFYGYLAGILILAVLTSIFQFKNNKDDEKSFNNKMKS